MFIIKSNSSDRKLVFSNLSDYNLDIALEGIGVSAIASIYLIPGYHAHELNKLFQELATYDRPWGDEKKWESIEHDFSIAVICDILGHVAFKVMLIMQQGHPEEARVDAKLVLDFGSLPSLAKEAQDFFVTAKA